MQEECSEINLWRQNIANICKAPSFSGQSAFPTITLAAVFFHL